MKKMTSAIWYILFLLVKYAPKSHYSITKGKLRSYFASKFIVSSGKNINIERGATFSRRLTIGNNSGIGVNSQLQGKITIGDNVMMGPEVYIYTTNHEFSRLDIPICQQGYQEEKEVVIGDDVWIGSRATILPGVTIANGCIIGAGAVVTKDTPPYTVVCGNPAKVVKKRGS
jgi:maltose O-acetyltransferase